MLKELFKGSAIYGMAPFIPKFLTIILLPILTKYLTSIDFGIIGTITSITLALQTLQNLGLQALFANYFYKCKFQYKIVWRQIYGFLSIWMIVYAIIQAVILYIFIPIEAESNKWLIILLSNFSTVLFGPTSLIGQKYFQLNLKPAPVAIRMIIAGVTTVLVNFFCVVVFRWGYLGAYIGSFAGTFLMNLSYWPVVNLKLRMTPIYNFNPKTIVKLLKVGIPIIPHHYSSYLMNSSNVVAMNYFSKPQAEIGYLTMSHQISGVFDNIINAINLMYSPMSYKFIRDQKKQEMGRLFTTFLLISYTLTFVYSLWAREAYQLLINNDEIAATYKYSIIFVMALNYRPTYVYCCNYFIYHEQTVKLLGISFVSGLICCVFYFTMIPYIGIYAALIGFYIGCLYQGYSGYLFKVYQVNTIYKPQWLFIMIIQLIVTFLAYYLVDYSLMVKIPITFLYIILFYMIFRRLVIGRYWHLVN